MRCYLFLKSKVKNKSQLSAQVSKAWSDSTTAVAINNIHYFKFIIDSNKIWLNVFFLH